MQNTTNRHISATKGPMTKPELGVTRLEIVSSLWFVLQRRIDSLEWAKYKVHIANLNLQYCKK